MIKAQETVLEINLRTLSHNYNYLASKLQPKTKFLAVVKAFAYGSDAVAISKKLQDLGADYFAVAYVKEGVLLRNAGITKPILVLHPQPINFNKIIEHCLEPSLYNATVLKLFIACATSHSQSNYPVHIKFNTGLNRLGFLKEDVHLIAAELEKTKAIKIKSVFSHLAASEDLAEIDFTKTQVEKFKHAAEILENLLGYKPWQHISNTSGVLNYPEAHLDMVRCGIGLYGFGNSALVDKQLLPIAELKSVISQIHHVKKGESVGYNRAYRVEQTEITATIPIGHADGLSRNLGNGNGFVIINNQKAPIIGNVCMDMIMVNITNIDCKQGDEVIIFNAAHNANTLASYAKTISYEILTAISQRVTRIVIDK